MKPILYVKTFCSWCWRAEAELKRLGVDYQVINILRDSNAYRKMTEISGQSSAPTLVVHDRVLADFGPEELRPFLAQVGLLA